MTGTVTSTAYGRNNAILSPRKNIVLVVPGYMYITIEDGRPARRGPKRSSTSILIRQGASDNGQK